METTMMKIPCLIDREQVLQKLHIKSNNPYIAKVDDMLDQAQRIADPKIAYKLAYIEEKGADYVIIEGIKFNSRVLSVNLEDNYKVIPFVITCGRELKEWADNYQQMFEQFCADGIMEWVLMAAKSTAFNQLNQEFNFSNTADMNPGSLPDWPLCEQKPLFQLLGDVGKLIGVELNDHCLMEPLKTISGIHFFKEGSYANCMLCPREGCPGRKAPYDKDLFAEKYQK